jgi:hypothetical protein
MSDLENKKNPRVLVEIEKATLYDKLKLMTPQEFAELRVKANEGKGDFDELLEKWPE